MRRATWIALTASLAVSGCTFGLGEVTTFATRNLSVSGDLADGTAFASDEGTVGVVPLGPEVEEGVMVFIEAGNGTQTLNSTLEFTGNLTALCPGARVELAGDSNALSAVTTEGAPAPMLEELSGLSLRMRTTTTGPGGETIEPRTSVITSRAGADGFAVLEITGNGVVDGETREFTATFEVARVLESRDVPGWEGDSWNGEPIASWD